MNHRVAAILLAAFTVSAAAFMAVGQPAEPPAQTPGQPGQPTIDPALDPAMEAAAQLQAAQDAQDAIEPTTQESADETTQPTTEPTTQDTTEPTTGPSTAPRAKRFTRSTSRPTGRGAVRWSGRSTSNAATAPTTGASQRPMSSDYAVLQAKSIFVKGHAADVSRSGGGGGGTTGINPPTSRADAAVLFNGVTDANDVLSALLEDTGSGKVSTVKVGDTIARGKVTKISLDTLEYESGGKTIKVSARRNSAPRADEDRATEHSGQSSRY